MDAVEARLDGLVSAREPDQELLWSTAGEAVESLSYESHRWAVRRLTRRSLSRSQRRRG